MQRKYRIEILCEEITPVSVIAGSESSAIEAVMNGNGDPCEAYPGETRIISAKCVDEDSLE